MGEHNPVSLRLLNILDREVIVRIQPEIPEELQAQLRISLPVVSSLGENTWDVLKPLDPSGIIQVPPFTIRELWIDLTTPDSTPVERFLEAKIRIQVLNGYGVQEGPQTPEAIPPPEEQIAIELETLPFIPASAGVFRLCCWASLSENVCQDLISHGNNVFCVPHGDIQTDENNQPKQVDYTKLDQILDWAGKEDVVILLQGLPAIRSTIGSDEYRSALHWYLNDLKDHLSSRGIDQQHYALYPYDEPGGHGWKVVNQLIDFGRVVKSIDPSVRIYINGGGETPMYEAMDPVADIWCPDLFMLPEDSPVMQIIRKSGKQLWSYNCSYRYSRPVGPNLKGTHLIAEYRTAALFALRHGATGIGFWSYNIGGDAWTRVLEEYPLVYPSSDGPISSRRWEAVREGIEDFRILSAVKTRLEAAKDSHVTSEAGKKYDHLMKHSLPQLLDDCYNAMLAGAGRESLDYSLNEDRLDAFRNEMLDCVELICRE